MKQLLSNEDLVGKQITTTEEIGNYFFIFFKDETFCVFHSPNTFNVEVALMEENYRPSYIDEIAIKLLQCGIISQADYDKSENVKARLQVMIEREQAMAAERKKEEDEYWSLNKNKVTSCCGSKNHFLHQGYPHCHECNSLCELE